MKIARHFRESLNRRCFRVFSNRLDSSIRLMKDLAVVEAGDAYQRVSGFASGLKLDFVPLAVVVVQKMPLKVAGSPF